jgi:hypothetical protein
MAARSKPKSSAIRVIKEVQLTSPTKLGSDNQCSTNNFTGETDFLFMAAYCVHELHVCHSHTNVVISWKESKDHLLIKETESGLMNIINAWSMCVLSP